MKKYLFAFFAAVLLLAMPASAESEITVLVNNKIVEFDQAPVFVNGDAYIPLRAVAEAFGMHVNYYAATQSIGLGSGVYDDIVMKIGSDKILIPNNTCIDKVYSMPNTALIRGGRTLLPMNGLAMALGADVSWNDVTKTASYNIAGCKIEGAFRHKGVRAQNGYIVPQIYDDVREIGGYFLCSRTMFVSHSTMYGLYDMNGNNVFEKSTSLSVELFRDGFLVMKADDAYYVITDEGGMVLENADENTYRTYGENNIPLFGFSGDTTPNSTGTLRRVLKNSDGRYYFLLADKNTLAFEKSFYDVTEYTDGYAVASDEENRRYIVDTQGNYTFVTEPNEGLIYDGYGYFRILKGGLQGVIDANGDTLLSAAYNDLVCAGENRYIASNGNGLFGCITVNGDIIIPFIYNYIDPYCEGYVRVGISKSDSANLFGFVNYDGKESIPLQFEGAGCFEDGKAFVYKYIEDKTFYSKIDTSGNLLEEWKLSEFAYPMQNGYRYVSMPERGGFADSDGNIFEASVLIWP